MSYFDKTRAELAAECSRLAEELAETRKSLEATEAVALNAKLALRSGAACTPAERAVLDELANAKIIAACKRGIRCCAKFEEPYEKYVCSKELARREATK